MKDKLRAIMLNMDFGKKLRITYILLLIIVVLPIGVFSYYCSYDALLESESNMMEKNLEQAVNIIDTNLEWYAQKSDILFYNSLFQENLHRVYRTTSERVDAIANISRHIEATFFDSMVDSRGSIVPENLRLGNATVKIHALNESLPFDGKYLHRFDPIAEDEWAAALRSGSVRRQWRYDSDAKGAYLVYDRALIHFDSQDFLGILSVYISINRMRHIMAQANSMENAYLALRHNEGIIWSNDAIGAVFSEVAARLFDGADEDEGDLIKIDGGSAYLWKKTELNEGRWQLSLIVDNNEILAKLQPFTELFIVLIGIGALLAVLLSVLVAKQITRRLRDITRHVEMLEHDPTCDLPVIAGKDEVGRLDKQLHHMVEALRSYKSREQAYEYNQAILQIDLLRAHINPHLLYNTMAAISWNAKKLGSSSIQNVTDNMIRFFRSYLNHGSATGTVQTEIAMVSNYIEIMKYTYELDMDAQIDADPSILNYTCANLILQPFVENAIVHGLRAKKEQPRMLSVLAKRAGDRLCFVVSDNGIGMDQSKLNRLFSETDASGYGIKNTKKRMDLYYQGRFQIEIISTPDRGTEVKMTFPVLGKLSDVE